jgi:hypothetical protein
MEMPPALARLPIALSKMPLGKHLDKGMCTHVGDDDVARCLPCNDLTVEPQGLNGIFAGVVGGFIAIDGGDRMFHGMTQHNARTTFIQLRAA